MEANKVLKKILYYVDIRCVSPICVSNGESELTDSDVLRNSEGNPFVAGSSLAGAMRNYLGFQKTEKCIFGYSSDTKIDGRMSSVFISDLEWKGKVDTAVRDGIKLTDNKISETKAKYDMEIVDTGAEGTFCIEVVIREEDEEEIFRSQIGQVLAGLQNKEIRLGARKTRGFGEIEINAVRKKEYTASNFMEYKEAYDPEKYEMLPNSMEKNFRTVKSTAKYIHIQVPLKQHGGISVRRYSAKKDEPDYVHLTAGGKPVIPGTSYNGAIRHRVKEILHLLKVPKAGLILELMYGYVEGEDAHKSSVIVGESVIADAVPLTMVRTAVSRFEGAARKGALYKEQSYFNGTTELNIYVQKGIEIIKEDASAAVDITDFVVGILLIALKDMQNGYLPVGGQTAIGRGILLGNGDIMIDGNSKMTEQYLINSMKIKEVLE